MFFIRKSMFLSSMVRTKLWLSPNEKNRLYFLAHLRLNLDLGSTKRLSHGLSQKVKSPIAQHPENGTCSFR